MPNQKKFVPLSNDLLFKEALSHPDNREFLIYFLELTTGLEEDVIRDNLTVRYESVLEKTRFDDKGMRGDVMIEFSNYIINLECYTKFDYHSFVKSMSYVMRIFSTQKDRGEDYRNLKSVIQISLVSCNSI